MKKKYVTMEDVWDELGPLAALTDPSMITEFDFNMAKMASNNASGVSSGSPNQEIHSGTEAGMEPIAEGTSQVWNGSTSTAAHELLHRVKGADNHDFMAAQKLFDSTNRPEALAALDSATHMRQPGENQDQRRNRVANTLKDIITSPGVSDIAGNEYDMGARLAFDPKRGHGPEKMLEAAIDYLTHGDEKSTYRKFRNMQSIYSEELRPK